MHGDFTTTPSVLTSSQVAIECPGFGALPFGHFSLLQEAKGPGDGTPQ